MRFNVEYVLTQQELDLLVESIAKLQIIVDDYKVGMNGKDRQGVVAMGPVMKPFVKEALDYAVNFPQFVPNSVDVTKARDDLKSFNKLEPLFNQYVALLQTLSDSLLLSGASAFKAARKYYHEVALEAEDGAKSASNVYNKLSPYFSKSGSTTDSSVQGIGVNPASSAGGEDGVGSIDTGASKEDPASDTDGNANQATS